MKTLKSLKLESTQATTLVTASHCCNCGSEGRATIRDFSVKAMQSLLAWNEVTEDLSAKPICNICYSDLREILIERADEVVEQPLQTFTNRNFSSHSLNNVSNALTAKTQTKKKMPVQVSL